MLAIFRHAAAERMTLPIRDTVHFQAPDYTHWTVHEVHTPTAPAERSLIFVSAGGFRRVLDYPADWRGLDAEALWALSWRR
jgi:hypothetical protein